MMNERVGVYPGSFDPITTGHIDIITRSRRLMDKLIVGVAINTGKDPLFSFDERMDMLRTELGDLPDGPGLAEIEVRPIDGLLVTFAKNSGASMIVRGLRAVSDFDYEFQMTIMNRQLNDKLETVFLMPSEQYSFLSSSLVKEVASFGGDVGHLVPKMVSEALKSRFKRSS